MTKPTLQSGRILAIAPSSRGFGFAVLEGDAQLVDWGVKSIKGDKNVGAVTKVKGLISLYQPSVLVLEDSASDHSRRSSRIRTLSAHIRSIAEKAGIKVALFPGEQVRIALSNDKQTTKHELAVMVAAQFPEELGSRLPPKRQPWMSADYRMDIFDAVALAIAGLLKKVGNSFMD